LKTEETMQETPQTYYRQNLHRYNEELAALKSRIAQVAFLRLVSFVVLALTAWLWLHDEVIPMMPATIVVLIIFVQLVRYAFRLNDKKKLLEKLVFLNDNELNILDDQPNGFPDGLAFTGQQDYTSDLDIFGPGSLFLLLNRCTTIHGTRQLAAALRNPFPSKESILKFQQAISTLSPQSATRQLLTAKGLIYGEKEGTLNEVTTWLQGPPQLHANLFVNILRFVLPVYNTGALLYFLDSNNYEFLTIGITVSWIAIGSVFKYIKQQHSLLSRKQAILDQYAAILEVTAAIDSGGSVLLRQWQSDAKAACTAIRQLSGLSRLFDQRSNLVVFIFLNSLFLYDIQIMLSLESWKKKYRDRFENWIRCVANIESANSFATFAFNNPAYTYPIITEGAAIIKAVQVSHPLIPAKENVANDFVLGEGTRLALVTGSNMSGKTTFLRTLGVNLLLGQCGAPVDAKEFSFTPMAVLTSIRVSDSLQEHTSYFMAELKRLQQIILHLRQDDIPALVLIDEILRGTNSDDKTHGSEQYIRKLLQHNCLTLFATHDLTLSKLENEFPGIIGNYCFESTIQNGELIFDYKLQSGVAKNRNASFLMKKMEII